MSRTLLILALIVLSIGVTNLGLASNTPNY